MTIAPLAEGRSLDEVLRTRMQACVGLLVLAGALAVQNSSAADLPSLVCVVPEGPHFRVEPYRRDVRRHVERSRHRDPRQAPIG